MILIDNRDELIKNLDTVESYLNGDNDEVVEIMAVLISLQADLLDIRIILSENILRRTMASMVLTHLKG